MATKDTNSKFIAKITDFGEARTASRTFAGRGGLMNPTWMAPEVN